MKKIFFVFLVSFLLNLVWENLHVYLYDNYMGGEITEMILLKATLADAIITMVILFPFLFFQLFRKYDFVIVPALVVISVLNEQLALQTGAWKYNSLMPVIPLISAGLTPTIQLGLLGYITYRLAKNKFKL